MVVAKAFELSISGIHAIFITAGDIQYGQCAGASRKWNRKFQINIYMVSYKIISPNLPT
jgi:hypothetical protein